MVFQSLMLIDIFSSFDPGNILLGNSIYIWALSLIVPLIFFSTYWVITTPYFAFVMFYIILIETQASRTNALNLPGLHHLLITLFIFLTSLNLLGLLPYVFSTTRHLVLTLSLGFPMWLILILSGVFFAPTSVAAGLIPGGAPSWLNPFLAIIETTRTGVQPGTLSFRLAANIRAGHIVITLLRIYLIISFWFPSWKIFILLLIVQIFYFLFEGGIAMIQAYIFCLLLSLYSEAHPCLSA